MESQTAHLAVQRGYLAFFGRAADQEGLEYWAQVAQEDGAGKMRQGLASSQEAQDYLYENPITGEEYSNEELVNTVYQNLFGRDADAEGLAFYSEQLRSGETDRVEVVQRIMDAADGEDLQILESAMHIANRVTAEASAEEIAAAYQEDRIWGTEDHNTLTGSHLEDRIEADFGHDTLEGRGGDDVLQGGEGDDVAVFQGQRSDYEIERHTGTHVEISDTVADRDGTDQLFDVETLQFADSVVEVANMDLVQQDQGNNAVTMTDGSDGSDDAVVYWGARDLAMPGGRVANHHFLRIEPSDPENFEAVDCFDFNGDGREDGFTIGGTEKGGGLFHYSELVGYHNDASDKEAIREASGEDSWHHQKYQVPLPDNETYDSFIDDLVDSYNAYLDGDPVKYALNPKLANHEVDGLFYQFGNCGSWVNTILKANGVSIADKVDDKFSAINWGIDTDIGVELFQPGANTLMGVQSENFGDVAFA